MTEPSSDTPCWHWLRFTVPAAYADEASGWCDGLDSCGWQLEDEDDATFTVYFAGSGAAAAARERLDAHLACCDVQVLSSTAGVVVDRDWAAEWQRSVVPLRASARIVVLPPWLPVPSEPGLVPVVIDPRMAFGTGVHASTRLCLRLLEGALRHGDRCLDLGTGSGVLAIAAVGLGAARVVAVDVDPVAVSEARENLAANGVATTVAVVREGSIEQAADETFQLVAANLQSGVIEPLVDPVRQRLAPGGVAIFSGLTEAECPAFTGLLCASGWSVLQTEALEGWVAVLAGHGMAS